MSPITRDWLVHGCMRLSDHDEEQRISLRIRNLISEMYQGVEFSIRSWPQRGFRDTLWWYEKSVKVPGQAASYFMKLDNWRGPNLYVGITVEKAYEDERLAREVATMKRQPVEWWLLDNSWDWHRAVASMSHVKDLVVSAANIISWGVNSICGLNSSLTMVKPTGDPMWSDRLICIDGVGLNR